jgi:hypothetical protein
MDKVNAWFPLFLLAVILVCALIMYSNIMTSGHP